MFKIVTWLNSIVFLAKKLESIKNFQNHSQRLVFWLETFKLKNCKWNHDLHTLFTFRVLTHFWCKPKIGWQYQKQKIWWTTNYHNRPGWYCRMVLPSRFPRVKLYCTRSGSAEDKKSTLVAEPRSDRDIVLQEVPRNHFDQSF